MHALTEAGCIRIFADKKSGKNAECEELAKALDLPARRGSRLSWTAARDAVGSCSPTCGRPG